MLKNIIKIIFLVCITLSANAIEIDEKSSNLDILSKSSLFLDITNSLTKEEVLEHTFVKNDKSILGYGFAEDYALWIKFSLKNTTDKTLVKVIEYDNPETEDILFYDANITKVDGMFHHPPNRSSINPNFEIKLEAFEERVYYIKAHCKISTLIAKVVLWNKDEIIRHNYVHKTYLFIFFAIIFTLFFYNLMLYIFTKERAYLYYILYLLGVVIFQSIYLGVAQLYILSNEMSELVTKATFTYISLLVIPIVLFTREFLALRKFPKIDIFLKYYLLFILLFCLLSFDNFVFNLNIIIVFIPMGIALIIAALYAYVKGEKQALFYIAGWSALLISLVLSVLRSLGGFDVTEYFLYVNEVAFALEALLFSIALAHRIKILAEEKSFVDAKLIAYQKTQQKKLEELVDEKTQKLEATLSEKEILYKELHHRVKNNIQMILSLIKLQILKTQSSETQKELEVTKNRIYSILYLYETLSIENVKLNTYNYIKSIVDNLEEQEEVRVTYNICYEPQTEKLLYVGLIVNELITNALKYAFNEKGNIFISLYKKEKMVYLLVEDDGKGFKAKKNNSLGLEIVKTLVEKQLFGEMKIVSNNGVKIVVSWNEDE